MKKLLALFLVAMMVLSLSATAFAWSATPSDPSGGSTPKPSTGGSTPKPSTGGSSGPQTPIDPHYAERMADILTGPGVKQSGNTATFDLGNGKRNFTILTDTLKKLKKSGTETVKFLVGGLKSFEIGMKDLLEKFENEPSVTTQFKDEQLNLNNDKGETVTSLSWSTSSTYTIGDKTYKIEAYDTADEDSTEEDDTIENLASKAERDAVNDMVGAEPDAELDAAIENIRNASPAELEAAVNEMLGDNAN